MNVGIYDTEHFETTYTAIKVFDTPGNYLAIFSTPEMLCILKNMLGNEYNKYQWILLEKNSLSNCFLIYKHYKQYPLDLLLLNTVSQHHVLFAFLCKLIRKSSCILTIHDANDFFKPGLKFTLRSIVKYVGKKLLARKVTYFSTLLSSTKKYIEETFQPNKELYCIPGSFFDEEQLTLRPSNTSITIVIPGSIDPKRRNYEDVFQLLKSIKAPFIIKLIFLGAAIGDKGKAVTDRFNHLKVNNVEIVTYKESFISSQEYDHQMSDCDIILAPLQQYYYGDSELPEQYGLTKSSGCFFDAIRFAKPILLNSTTIIPREIEAQCFQYQSIEQLVEFFNKLSHMKIAQLKENAIKNSTQFTLENIRKRLPKSLSTLN